MPSDPFKKIKREESLSHKVEQQIRTAIRQKIFLPGDRLPSEIELAEKFGVSRTAIREAVRVLSGKGLVSTRKGSGVYVSEIDMSNVVDPFYELLEMKCGEASLLHLIRVRLFIEPEIAKLAAQHCSEEDIQYLSEKAGLMEKHANNPSENIESDIMFHRRIANATNNPIIPIIMEPIFQLLHKFISTTYRQSHAPDLAIKYHRELVNCLQNKDGERAYVNMREHLLHAEKHVIKYFESIGFTDFSA